LTSDLIASNTPSAPIEGLSFKEDVSQLRNAIYVEGGEGTSVLVTEFFELSYTSEAAPQDAYIRRKVSNNKTVVFGSFQVRLTETWGTIPEFPTIGTDGIDDPADFDMMVNYNEGSFWFVPPFFEQGLTVFAAAAYVQVSHRYTYPLLTYLEDATTIALDGRFEHVAKEKKLITRDNLETYALADLTYFKKSLKSLGYVTTRTGLVLGTQQTVTLPRLGINGEYLITRITTQYLDYLQSATPWQSANTYFKKFELELEAL
jgi:hypothetical protein